MNQQAHPFEQLLQAFIPSIFPDHRHAKVVDFHEISAGWESDVYAFDLIHSTSGDRGREALVLRVYPGTDAVEKSALEFAALQRLYRAGYPVPQAYHLTQTASPLGKPFMILERVPGTTVWGETFHGPEAQQARYFDRFIRLLVQLHALDWRNLVDDEPVPFATDPYVFVDAWLAKFRAFAEQVRQPGYAPALDWLAARRDAVPCARPAPIHWDFHPNNILVDAAGEAKVIDWTQYEISDPRFDLAWTMTLIGCYEGDAARRRVLERYQAVSGSSLDQMDWFEVFACTKRLASVTFSLAAGAEQLGMRPGAEEVMRAQLPALSRVYDRFVTLSEIRLPEVEALLAEG